MSVSSLLLLSLSSSGTALEPVSLGSIGSLSGLTWSCSSLVVSSCSSTSSVGVFSSSSSSLSKAVSTFSSDFTGAEVVTVLT